MAWQRISPKVTVKGFRNCSMSSATDGTDVDIWDESAEDGNVSSGCDKDVGTGCEDGDRDTD